VKILLDQNISTAIAGSLRESGIDAIHTRVAGLATAEDEDILEWCRHENRVAITRDAAVISAFVEGDVRAPFGQAHAAARCRYDS
jgi:predicted nuclease of predicted toxin-antitoxin system